MIPETVPKNDKFTCQKIMKKITTNIKDCFLIEIDRNFDHRGFFEELFNENFYEINVKQVSHSFSLKGTIRGIHISPYFKIVSCLKGKIFDVCVDLRKQSDSYLQYYCCIMDESQQFQMFCPAYCGHAFLALEDSTVVYSQGGVFNSTLDNNIFWKDPLINIQWPQLDSYILSEKDAIAKCLIEENDDSQF